MQREEPNFPTEEVENLKWLSDIIKQMVRHYIYNCYAFLAGP